ncbi:MAG: type II toxin-antitoxin system YafQ family toxin [Candidatus Dadabacteria bacterium]|nr:type II toxin-antitoxin system YafQ family toxin [Candidatus Dadabacteria bacterium]
MARKIKSTKSFKKDLKRVAKRNKDIAKLDTVIELLANDVDLPIKNEDHRLTGQAKKRECHIEPNWLLIYEKREKFLVLHRTGSHPDLFE